MKEGSKLRIMLDPGMQPYLLNGIDVNAGLEGELFVILVIFNVQENRDGTQQIVVNQTFCKTEKSSLSGWN